METRPFRPRLAIGGVPIHAMLVPFTIACFTGAMLADFAYVNAPHPQWANFAQWLLAFGLVFGVPAALAGAVDLFGNAASARPRIGMIHFLGNVLMLVLALFNSFVHARDGWTGVYPAGITLSVLTVAIMIVTGFLGHRMAHVYQGGRA